MHLILFHLLILREMEQCPTNQIKVKSVLVHFNYGRKGGLFYHSAVAGLNFGVIAQYFGESFLKKRHLKNSVQSIVYFISGSHKQAQFSNSIKIR